jgi:hypothetical protein
MRARTLLFTLVGLALAQAGRSAIATDAPPGSVGSGIQEVSDQELGGLRGRYTIDNNTIAWFGVSMISDWQTSSGRLLKGTLTLGMDFRHGSQPKITFVPTVSITAANAPMPSSPNPPTGGLVRSVNGAGLANVGGLLQGVQVAGDNNLASNVTRLSISDGGTPPAAGTGNGSSGTATASDGGASVSASYANGVAQVLLNVDGIGRVRQWIQAGSLGQTVQLAADSQIASNSLQIQLIRQMSGSNVPLQQSVTQALSLVRGFGIH